MKFDLSDFVRDKASTINAIIACLKEKRNLIENEYELEDNFAETHINDENPAVFFYVKYQNSKGIKSEKIIRLFKCYWQRGDIYFTAKQLDENRVKTFIVSRVLSLINPETGEVIDDAATYFQNHPLMDLKDKSELTPEGRAVAEFRDEIYLLSLMAAVDEEIHVLEYDYIISYIANSADVILNETQIKKHLCLLEPTEYAIIAAINRLKSLPERQPEFLRAIRNLMLADGILHENEVGFCQYLLNNLKYECD